MGRIFLVSILILPLMGCGKHQTGVVSGTLTYKGQRVGRVTLHLYPVPGPGEEVLIPVNPDGTFRTGDVPPSEYKIVVQSPDLRHMPPPPKTTGDPAKDEEIKQKYQQAYKQQPSAPSYPDKYRSILNTDLTCTVTENTPPLNLEMKD